MLYLRIGSLGLPFALIALAGHGYLRGVSDLRLPLVIVVVANVVNVLLNVLFIYGFDWGLAGSAWATVVAQAGMGAAFAQALLRAPADSRRPSLAAMRPLARIGGAPTRAESFGPVSLQVDDRAAADAFELGRREREHVVPRARRRPDDVVLEQSDYEEAATCFDRCRTKGLPGSNTDFLMCAVSLRRELAILTTDRDFKGFARVLGFDLHEPR